MSMSDAVDTHLLNLLRKRDGAATLVELRSGNTLRVLNIAWGYDIGEPYAHVSTNVGPSIEGESFDFFHTYEVVRLRDPGTNKTLIEASGDAVAAGHWLRSLGFELVVAKGEGEASVTLRSDQGTNVEYPTYGSGQTEDEATLSAARRWRAEEIG